jgi:hypothetical protein
MKTFLPSLADESRPLGESDAITNYRSKSSTLLTAPVLVCVQTDYELVDGLLTYNQETGVFTWKTETAAGHGLGHRAGDIAGTVSGRGYLVVRIKGVPCYAHRLAWLCIRHFS